jgi:hypothetical protein
MIRFMWTAAFLAVLSSVVVLSAAAGPTDPPYPARINFPAPTVDPTTGAVTTNFSPEGMAISGNNFYAGSTQTGEIIKGNIQTGVYQRNWVAASPPQPSDMHRGTLGMLVDSHGRLWVAGSMGMACGGTGQPACPAGTPSPQFNYGVIFVYDANTGAELAQYTTTNATAKTMNDITIANNAVFVSNTTAPGPAGTENQIKIQLSTGGALPPGDIPPPGNTGTTTPCGTTLCPTYSNPAVTILPTPGFTGADGIDTLPNGHVLFTSFTGTASGRMINMDPATGAWSDIAVTAPDRPGGEPPLLSLDGVTLDGNMLYAPENRLDQPPFPPPNPPAADTFHCPAPFQTVPCPGDWAAIHLDPPDYTTAEVITRLNSPPGSGLPPLRSPANMEQLGHSVYGITRVVSPNPVTGLMNVTQTFIERLDKVPLTATGSAVTGVEGASATMSSAATFSDPNNGPLSGDYPQNGSSVYGYTASIDWGDGSTSAGTITRTSAAGADVGTFSVSGSHAYAEEGTYTVTTTVKDAATGFTIATTTSTAIVADAPLTAGAISTTCSGGSCAVSFAFTDANTAAPVSDFAATIHWADGSTSAGTVASLGGGKFVVTGSHPGTGGAVTVTVADDGGSTVMSAASPAATANLVPNANGAVNGNAQSAKFTVVAECGAGSTASATLNGIAVSNGQTVRLKAANKNGGSVKVNGDGLSITADSFELVVTCTDAAGNQGSSVATWTP